MRHIRWPPELDHGQHPCRDRTPRPEDPAEAVRLAVEGFRLIAGPHFDADEIGGMVRTAHDRNVNPLGTIRQLVAIQASPDRTAALQQVRVPTLVIPGLRDQLVMPRGGIATARAVPGSRLVAFPDMAHDLPGPRRAEIVEEISRNAARATAGEFEDAGSAASAEPPVGDDEVFGDVTELGDVSDLGDVDGTVDRVGGAEAVGTGSA